MIDDGHEFRECFNLNWLAINVTTDRARGKSELSNAPHLLGQDARGTQISGWWHEALRLAVSSC